MEIGLVIVKIEIDFLERQNFKKMESHRAFQREKMISAHNMDLQKFWIVKLMRLSPGIMNLVRIRVSELLSPILQAPKEGTLRNSFSHLL
jgi:hypothetical protein